MSEDKELRVVVLNYVLILAAVLILFAALVYLFIWLGNGVIAPLVSSLTVYLDKYGRITAEGFTLFSLAGIGLQFHEQLVSGITRDFLEHIKTLDLDISASKSSRASYEKDVIKLNHKIDELNFLTHSDKGKIKLLAEENIHLQTEIERLKDPDGMAKKEQAAIQKHNDQNLKSIAESIRWGRS
jgi:peptidoglycan hydrolase CwlO-like protein